MIESISGGCLCGSIRYEYSGEVGPASYCHCDDCRRVTGSAFGISLRMETEQFNIVSGDLGAYEKVADSGMTLTRHFCRKCGSPIYTSSPRHADHIYIKAGSLDAPDIVKPSHQSWLRSSVSWRNIPNGLTGHETSRFSTKS